MTISRRKFLKDVSCIGTTLSITGVGDIFVAKNLATEARSTKEPSVNGTSEQVNASKGQIKALAFDAYGTLFDVASVITLCEQVFPGKGAAVSQMWRTKQLEYSWLRSLMARYEDFSYITESALAYASNALGLSLSDANRTKLMDAYLHLKPFPEVPSALKKLSATCRLAILSNGTPHMLEAVVKNAALTDAFTEIISVEAVKIYKPSPHVYDLAIQKLGVPKDSIGFVSSNCWDAVGAKSFGFRTFWVNRGGLPVDELGVRPDDTLKNLTELAPLIA